jgi:hypothetical protein
VCGDSNCETTEGENCETCPKDCGKCPLKTWEIGLIAAAGVVFIGTIAGIYAVSFFEISNALCCKKRINYHIEFVFVTVMVG